MKASGTDCHGRTAIQLFRSFLFAPGNHARRVEKALSLDADAVILDLEDAVATAEKRTTRDAVIAALTRPRRPLLYVRVNSADTEFCYGDLAAIVRPGLDGIILPKVESAAGLATVDWLLAQLEREHGLTSSPIDLIPIIETARGLSQIDAILASGSRVKRIAFGAGDFTLDVNMAWSRNEAELAYARARIVIASRAAGIEAPLDTVWVDLADVEGLEASARTALVSNDLTLETSCRDFRSCERRDDHGLSNTAERCGSGAADAGEVVAIGSSDPLDYAEVAEPAKLA